MDPFCCILFPEGIFFFQFSLYSLNLFILSVLFVSFIVSFSFSNYYCMVGISQRQHLGKTIKTELETFLFYFC